MGEAAGNDDRIDVAGGGFAVPQDLGFAAEAAHGFDHVELTVRPGEENDTDPCAHGPLTVSRSAARMVTDESSITGLVRNR